MTLFPNGTEARQPKNTIRELKKPKQVILPLGPEPTLVAAPLIKPGDRVVEGQKIADSDQPGTLPVHASLSGRVIRFDDMTDPFGNIIPTVVIEAEAGDEKEIIYESRWSLEELDPGQVRRIIRKAGIADLQGRDFPWIKEVRGSYPTADHAVMEQRPTEVALGSMAMAKAVGIEIGTANQPAVAILIAAAEAIAFGRPFIKKAIAVAGTGIKGIENVNIRLGTELRAILIELTGRTDQAAVQPAMGIGGQLIAVTLDASVVKETEYILFSPDSCPPPEKLIE